MRSQAARDPRLLDLIEEVQIRREASDAPWGISGDGRRLWQADAGAVGGLAQWARQLPGLDTSVVVSATKALGTVLDSRASWGRSCSM